MFKSLSDDEKKFVWFWVFVFSSAVGFWAVVVHWSWQLARTYLA